MNEVRPGLYRVQFCRKAAPGSEVPAVYLIAKSVRDAEMRAAEVMSAYDPDLRAGDNQVVFTTLVKWVVTMARRVVRMQNR